MQANPRILSGLICALIVGFVSGCGGDSTAGDYPPPGEMRVVSVKPVEGMLSSREVYKFSFENWFPGAPRPTGPFITPGDHIALFPADRQAADGNICMRIEWSSPDSKWSEQGRFGVILEDLEPETTYAVSLQAAAVSTLPVHLEAYALMQEDSFVPATLPVLTIRAEPPLETFEGTFTTGVESRTALLFSCIDIPDGQKYKLVIDDVQIEHVGPANYASLEDPDGVNLILNGSFEVWPPGASAPRGPWQAPAGNSRIEPNLRRSEDGLRNLHQIWEDDDSADSPEALFGVDVEGLEKNKEYIFTCYGDSLRSFSADIAVYGRGADGTLAKIKDPLVTLRPSNRGFVELTGRFMSGPYTDVRIVSRGPGPGGEFPSRVLWDAWRLQRPNAKPVAPAEDTAPDKPVAEEASAS
jgi:hypothetical protein